MLAIAHRAPSSAEAAAQRIAAGARMFEIDVQLRRGRIVCSHYLPLTGPLRGLPIERDNWRLRRGFGNDPELGLVLDRIPADCDVLLDPKHHPGMSAEGLLAGLVDVVASERRPERFVVSTSDRRLLAGYRSGGLRTWRSIGDRAGLAAALARDRLPEEGVSIRHSLLDAETITALHAVTGIIAAWTVNGISRAQQLFDLGVDALTSDRLAVLDVAREHTE